MPFFDTKSHNSKSNRAGIILADSHIECNYRVPNQEGGRLARKNNGNDSDNNAEIKVFYFEAKNVNSDLSGTLAAFANAIRIAPVQTIPNQPPAAQIEGRRTAPTSNGQQELNLEEDENNAADIPVAASTPKAETRERKPEDTTKKFLVIASWFKRHGGHEKVNANLIYNGYRKLSWSALADMTQTLRDGAKSERGYYIGDGKGFYAITNIGLDAADKANGEKLGSG